jgi:anti-sigma factor RsiW
MHAVVLDSLEEYLSGDLAPAAQRIVEAHLGVCNSCREEIQSMRDVSQMFLSLRSGDAPEPAPGFSAGVMQQMAGLKPAPTFASLFALDFAFGRRLAFACLVLLAVLGTFLATHEAQAPFGPSPEAIMAQQEAPAFDSAAQAQDNMLVTLTAYEQH